MQSSDELVRGFLGQVFRAATGLLSGPTAAAVASLVAAKADIDWHDPAARKEHLGGLMAARRAVLAEVAPSADPAVAEAAEWLAQVIDYDTEADEDGNPQIRQGVPAIGL